MSKITTITENTKRCMEFMKDSEPKKSYGGIILRITTEDELMFRLSLLPEESKNIIIAKWGLDGSKYCHSFKTLDSKFGVEDSRSIYTEALKKLAKAKALVANQDGNLVCTFEGYTTDKFNEANSCARIRATVFGTYDLPPYGGTLEDFKTAFEDVSASLSPRETEVLKFHFGLNKYEKPMTLDETENEFMLTRPRVLNMLHHIFQKLRYPIRARNLRYANPTHTKAVCDIDHLNISDRSKLFLIRSGYSKIEDFIKLSEEDLMQIRNLGRKGLEECLTAQKNYVAAN